MYNLRLLDIHRNRIAIIDQVETWRYNRRPSEATEISVTLPRETVEAALPGGVDLHAFFAPYQVVAISGDEHTLTKESKHEHARIAHYVQIYRGTRHVVTGRISKRDIGDDTVTIRCHTEEIELESHITPAQYGRKWDHWDLADVARDMLRGWHVQRVKDKTQWDAAIERVNVDTSTEPGVVMLAKSGGKYVSQGHITLRFSKADVPGFHSWDRIRWASDNVAPVRTTMQWRADGGPWSQEMEGALPDEVGVVPGSADADVIDVRINLYTDDQETEDAEGNPVGQTPYVFAVEMIARTEGRIEAGDIPAAAGVLVSGLEADGASALNVLSQACEQAGWEFWVSDGKLNLAEEMGEDRTSSVLLRAGTNMTVQTLSEGDDELVNVLVAYGPGEGINRLQVTRRHEESIARYGEYRGVQTFEGATSLADLIQAADNYLEAHAAPVPAFRVEAQYPYGEEPAFGCGDYVRVADPRAGLVTRSRIAEETRSYSTAGLKTTLYLGMPAPDLARTVRPTPPPRPVQPPDKPVISVSPIPGGIRVVDTKAPNIRWSTSRVYASTTKGFTPSAETLVADGRRVRFDISGLTPGLRYYVKVIRYDTDGNPSPPSDEMSAVAGEFPEEEIPAELFQIRPSSDPPPTSGSLETLWDMDTSTGASWSSGPVTVTFEYPMQWFFDMVRLYTTTARAYYVEARTKEGTWTKVTGDHTSVANGYTVQRFAQNKMVVTDALRIVFPGSAAVNVRELKFWTITLADEILAQRLRLTGDMAIEGPDGGIRMDRQRISIRVNETDRIVQGLIEGLPWGDGVLPPGTLGTWGDRAGLYLRGYARLLDAGFAFDEDEIDLSGLGPLGDVEVLVAPKEMVTYSPERDTLSHMFVDAIRLPNGNYKVKAKVMVKGQEHIWGGRSNTRNSWTYTRPTESIDGKKGVYTDFIICRPTWRVGSGGLGLYTARLWLDVTNEFDQNGDPINWRTVRQWSRSSAGSGTLNWDTKLDEYGQWAVRVRGQGGGSVLVPYAETGLQRLGYRSGDTYLDVDGNVITGPDPGSVESRMSVLYMVLDRG